MNLSYLPEISLYFILFATDSNFHTYNNFSTKIYRLDYNIQWYILDCIIFHASSFSLYYKSRKFGMPQSLFCVYGHMRKFPQQHKNNVKRKYFQQYKVSATKYVLFYLLQQSIFSYSTVHMVRSKFFILAPCLGKNICRIGTHQSNVNCKVILMQTFIINFDKIKCSVDRFALPQNNQYNKIVKM